MIENLLTSNHDKYRIIAKILIKNNIKNVKVLDGDGKNLTFYFKRFKITINIIYWKTNIILTRGKNKPLEMSLKVLDYYLNNMDELENLRKKIKEDLIYSQYDFEPFLLSKKLFVIPNIRFHACILNFNTKKFKIKKYNALDSSILSAKVIYQTKSYKEFLDYINTWAYDYD